METNQPQYVDAYRSLRMTRDAQGVLVVEFHTGGGPLIFTAHDHTEFVDAFYRIAQDRANKIVILTGTGGEFIPGIDFSSFGNVADPDVWSQVHDEGVQILENLANIRVPVIAAIEGRADVHSEYALLANVIVAAEGATFNDLPHFAGGIVPGDGIFTTWSYRAGAGRAEAFLLNPQPVTETDRARMGSGGRGCAKWQRTRSCPRVGVALPESSGSHSPQHSGALHPAVKRAHRTRSWLRTLARRGFGRGSR
jgi:enoyl-CoA hydratase/carnithine racemase